MKRGLRGFSYFVDRPHLLGYRHMAVEKRLGWLYQGNILRAYCPEKIKRLQDKFRNAEV
ncbi:MAG: hypothetical protein PHG31_06540 [Candidatus Omnitrophica bacterium]|nr:hypothetical protein [Candidatus Omnitrophota bacterium]